MTQHYTIFLHYNTEMQLFDKYSGIIRNTKIINRTLFQQKIFLPTAPICSYNKKMPPERFRLRVSPAACFLYFKSLWVFPLNYNK